MSFCNKVSGKAVNIINWLKTNWETSEPKRQEFYQWSIRKWGETYSNLPPSVQSVLARTKQIMDDKSNQKALGVFTVSALAAPATRTIVYHTAFTLIPTVAPYAFMAFSGYYLYYHSKQSRNEQQLNNTAEINELLSKQSRNEQQLNNTAEINELLLQLKKELVNSMSQLDENNIDLAQLNNILNVLYNILSENDRKKLQAVSRKAIESCHRLFIKNPRNEVEKTLLQQYKDLFTKFPLYKNFVEKDLHKTMMEQVMQDVESKQLVETKKPNS